MNHSARAGRVQRSLRTRIAHAGERNDDPNRPLTEPIHQSSVYAFADSHSADRAYANGQPLYSRDGLPNVQALERAVADLEGAEAAHAVSSGMAAIAITFLAVLKSGDHIVIGHEGYCDTAELLNDMSRKFDLRISRVDLADANEIRSAMTPATRMIFAETISNPGMRLADLPMLAEIAGDSRALLVVDNTFATPALCRPIAFGADCVVHSAGKFLGGHHDVTAGVIAGTSELIATIKRLAYLYGPLLAPMEAWLTLRGLKTLAPRMEWSSRSAAKIADWLAVHPAVSAVHYAGRPGPELVALAMRLLPSGAGSVLAFTLRDGEQAADDVIQKLTTIPYVPSVGGTTTIASFPPRSPSFDPDGTQIIEPYHSATIRLSVGLEDPSELIAELDQALAVNSTRFSFRSRSFA